MSKILLINYSKNEAKRVSDELGVEVQRGCVADLGEFAVNRLGVSSPIINFYIPESFAEFQAVFMNFNIAKEVKEEFKEKARGNYEENGKSFLKDYWVNNQGYLVIFTGDDLIDLDSLGIPLKVRTAQKTDRTARLGMRIVQSNSFRVSLREQLKNIQMPASHYITTTDDKYMKKYLKAGRLYRVYTNSGSMAIGVYIDRKQDESDYGLGDSPQAMLLPTFKSLPDITIALTRSFSKLSPKFLPLSDAEWLSSDAYYPKSIAIVQEKINEAKRLAEQKIKDLEKKKAEVIKENSHYLGILTQTGDDLVESINWLLSNVLGLNVVDVDAKDGASNRKEDLLITKSDGVKMLAEVKGTKSEYPSPKYIGQATNHFIRKAKLGLGVEKCVLIINHDYQTEPRLRKQAYTGDDSELLNSMEYVSYLDTRVLHKICLAVANGTLSKEAAIKIVAGDGRIEYDEK